MASPLGNPVAAKVRGACPVAAIVCRKGLPGIEPTTVAPLIRGIAGGLSIEMVMSVCAAKAGADGIVAHSTASARVLVFIGSSSSYPTGDFHPFVISPSAGAIFEDRAVDFP